MSRQGRLAQLLARGVGVTTTALSGPIDVHIVTHEQARQGRRHLAPASGLTMRRQIAGFALAAAGLSLATVLLASLRGQLSLASDILTVMIVVVAAAIVEGFLAGHRRCGRRVLAVSAVVGLAARRTPEAARACADAEVLFNLAGHVLRGEHALTDLLDRLRETFGRNRSP